MADKQQKPKPTTLIDSRELHRAAIRSSLVYRLSGEGDYTWGMQVPQRFQKAGLDEEVIDVIDDGATQAVVSVDNETIHVTFRGTEMSRPEDVTNDAKGCMEGIGQKRKVHAGALKTIRHLQGRLNQAMRYVEDAEHKRVQYQGHSWGGLLAMLRAYHFPRSCKSVYTFGAPMIGNKAFCEDYTKRLGARTFRTVRGIDRITCLWTQRLLGYRHPNAVLLYIGRDKLAVEPFHAGKAWDQFTIWLSQFWHRDYYGLKHHSMNEYKSLIAATLTPEEVRDQMLRPTRYLEHFSASFDVHDVHAYDGDTYIGVIKVPVRIRERDLWCPEVRGEFKDQGHTAADIAEEILRASKNRATVHMQSRGRLANAFSFGRIVGSVQTSNGQTMSDQVTAALVGWKTKTDQEAQELLGYPTIQPTPRAAVHPLHEDDKEPDA